MQNSFCFGESHFAHCIIYLHHLRPVSCSSICIFIQPNTLNVFFPWANCKSRGETATKEMYIRSQFKLSVEKTLFARLNIFSITCRLVLSMGHFFFFQVICFEGEERWNKVPPLHCLCRDQRSRGLLSCENKKLLRWVNEKCLPGGPGPSGLSRSRDCVGPSFIWASNFQVFGTVHRKACPTRWHATNVWRSFFDLEPSAWSILALHPEKCIRLCFAF